jgi:hypothetical protein
MSSCYKITLIEIIWYILYTAYEIIGFPSLFRNFFDNIYSIIFDNILIILPFIPFVCQFLWICDYQTKVQIISGVFQSISLALQILLILLQLLQHAITSLPHFFNISYQTFLQIKLYTINTFVMVNDLIINPIEAFLEWSRPNLKELEQIKLILREKEKIGSCANKIEKSEQDKKEENEKCQQDKKEENVKKEFICIKQRKLLKEGKIKQVKKGNFFPKIVFFLVAFIFIYLFIFFKSNTLCK